jgi:hypothetical protein
MKSIRHILVSILFASTMSGLAEEAAKPDVPSWLIREVGGELVTSIRILPVGKSQTIQKLKGTRVINVEPGCIMVEAYVKLTGENEIEIRFPHDDLATTRTLKTMGVSSKDVTIAFTRGKAANQAGTIVAVTPIQTKSSEQGGADQPATAPELKSEGKDKPQPESKVRPR